MYVFDITDIYHLIQIEIYMYMYTYTLYISVSGKRPMDSTVIEVISYIHLNPCVTRQR